MKKNPISVLEIGPGSGYYSKMIFDHPSVLNYDFIDINDKFLEFIAERIANSNKKNNFSSNTFIGDVSSFDFQNKKYDLIVLLVKHDAFLKKLKKYKKKYPNNFLDFFNLIN